MLQIKLGKTATIDAGPVIHAVQSNNELFLSKLVQSATRMLVPPDQLKELHKAEKLFGDQKSSAYNLRSAQLLRKFLSEYKPPSSVAPTAAQIAAIDQLADLIPRKSVAEVFALALDKIQTQLPNLHNEWRDNDRKLNGPLLNKSVENLSNDALARLFARWNGFRLKKNIPSTEQRELLITVRSMVLNVLAEIIRMTSTKYGEAACREEVRRIIGALAAKTYTDDKSLVLASISRQEGEVFLHSSDNDVRWLRHWYSLLYESL